MKDPFLLLIFLTQLFIGIIACKMENKPAANRVDAGNGNEQNMIKDQTGNRLRIKVGSSTFTATLLTNPTVTAFKAKLPLTLSMKELNGNDGAARAEVFPTGNRASHQCIEPRNDSGR